MVTGRCEQCSVEEYMPYVCKFCRGHYCAEHRLPENHGCNGLELYKERVRAEGRLMAPEPSLVRPRVKPGARLTAGVDRLFDKLEGRAAMTLLAVMGGAFLLQILLGSLSPRAMTLLFVMGPDFFLRPWTIVTSIFAHGDFNHFLVNGLVLFFFGPTLERLVGSRNFTYLFLGSGVAAGLAQVVLFGYLLEPLLGIPNEPTFVVGASGALMGVLGTLTLLAPRLTVLLFFVLPTPLWLITIAYAALDLLGLFAPSSNVAHLAHLVGLAIGLAYGKRLRDRGVRAYTPAGQGVQWRRYI